MVHSHPYISGAGNITKMIGHLRSHFPATVTSETVKRFEIAGNNESSVINTLQFLKVIDQDGNQIRENTTAFQQQNDQDFQQRFKILVEKAYEQLFKSHRDESWALNDETLITFFRQTDHTSEIIGKRQANVFKSLAALSGMREQPTEKQPTKTKTPGKTASSSKRKMSQATSKKPVSNRLVDSLGMSIKIDINLPADASKETYENIFKSIREQLLDG